MQLRRVATGWNGDRADACVQSGCRAARKESWGALGADDGFGLAGTCSKCRAAGRQQLDLDLGTARRAGTARSGHRSSLHEDNAKLGATSTEAKANATSFCLIRRSAKHGAAERRNGEALREVGLEAAAIIGTVREQGAPAISRLRLFRDQAVDADRVAWLDTGVRAVLVRASRSVPYSVMKATQAPRRIAVGRCKPDGDPLVARADRKRLPGRIPNSVPFC